VHAHGATRIGWNDEHIARQLELKHCRLDRKLFINGGQELFVIYLQFWKEEEEEETFFYSL
jgi:hypothetical protein